MVNISGMPLQSITLSGLCKVCVWCQHGEQHSLDCLSGLPKDQDEAVLCVGHNPKEKICGGVCTHAAQ